MEREGEHLGSAVAPEVHEAAAGTLLSDPRGIYFHKCSAPGIFLGNSLASRQPFFPYGKLPVEYALSSRGRIA